MADVPKPSELQNKQISHIYASDSTTELARIVSASVKTSCSVPSFQPSVAIKLIMAYLRKSNTEPIIRIYTEAKTQTEADALATRFMEEMAAIS